MQTGNWVLLDEINLAPESVLHRLQQLIEGDYVLLNERADVVSVKKHKDFRIFLCMNPPYSSAGKKQLPFSLRSRVQEIYVPELENQSDLWDIVDKNSSRTLNETVNRQILDFYMKVRQASAKNEIQSGSK